MSKRLALLITLVCSVVCIALWRPSKSFSLLTTVKQAATTATAKSSYARLPLHFEANKGQTAVPGVDYIARGNGFGVYLTSQGPIVTLREVISAKELHRRERLNKDQGRVGAPTHAQALIGMHLIGAQPSNAEALESMPGKINYYFGDDPEKWITGVGTYGRVRYKSVYPGIDLVYYGNQRNLEYDFVVAPGADPNQIRIDLQGMDKAELDANGNLVLSAASRQLVQHRPVVYQEFNGTRQRVEGQYALNGNEAAFKVGEYDRSRQLVIDPIFTFGTFIGGDGEDKGHSVAMDPAGFIYVSGSTSTLDATITRSTDPQTVSGVPFPIKAWWTNSTITAPGGVGNSRAVDGGNHCCMGSDAGPSFVAKLDPTGATLVYASYLGGFSGYRQSAGALAIHGPCPDDIVAAGECRGTDAWSKGWSEAFALAVDRTGRAYIGGHAEDVDFPTTADALRRNHPHPLHPGFPEPDNGRDNPMWAYLSIFEPDGRLKYSTLIGGHSDGTKTNALSVVDTGAFQGIWLTGEVTSTDFFSCTTPTGCPETGPVDAAMNPDGIGTMPAINSYQTQIDQAPCTNHGPRTTYYGASVTYPGAGPDMVGCVQPITAPVECHDPATNALQNGTNGRGMSCWDNGFIFRLTLDGKNVIWSTIFGGTGDGAGYTIKPDPATGIAYYAGDTEATDFPTTKGAFQTCLGGNGGYPGDFAAPATNSASAPNAGKGFPSSYTGYTPQAPITGHLATGADVTSGSTFPCNLSPSPQTWDFEVAPPTQKWKPFSNATVAKFGPDGTLLYSSYLGGSSDTSAGAPASNFTGGLGSTADFDRLGNLYVSGWTEANLPYCGTPAGSSAPDCNPDLNDPRRTSFPFTAGVFQTAIAQDPTATCAGPVDPANPCVPPNKRKHTNAFVTKIDTNKTFDTTGRGWDGTVPVPPGRGMVWSTYLGGYGDEEIYGLVTEKGPNTGCPDIGACEPAVYILGLTDSFNAPICGNGLGPAIGPKCQQGALDTTQAGSAAMTGPYNGRYLNGVPPDFVAFPPNPATGYPGGYNSTFPPQSQDALLVKVMADGSGLVYATYLGGRGDEEGHGLSYVNRSNFRGVIVTGLTNSDGRGYCGEGTPSTPQEGSGTVPPPSTWTCAEKMNIPPGNPFPTSFGAFQTAHAPSRVVPGIGSYSWAVECTGPSHPTWTGTEPDCRPTVVPQAPNEDVFIVKIADL